MPNRPIIKFGRNLYGEIYIFIRKYNNNPLPWSLLKIFGTWLKARPRNLLDPLQCRQYWVRQLQTINTLVMDGEVPPRIVNKYKSITVSVFALHFPCPSCHVSRRRWWEGPIAREEPTWCRESATHSCINIEVYLQSSAEHFLPSTRRKGDRKYVRYVLGCVARYLAVAFLVQCLLRIQWPGRNNNVIPNHVL